MYQDETEKELEASGFRISDSSSEDEDSDTLHDEPPLFFDDENEDNDFDKDH